MRKRWIAALLAVCMLLGLIPAALAETPEAQDSTPEGTLRATLPNDGGVFSMPITVTAGESSGDNSDDNENDTAGDNGDDNSQDSGLTLLTSWDRDSRIYKFDYAQKTYGIGIKVAGLPSYSVGDLCSVVLDSTPITRTYEIGFWEVSGNDYYWVDPSTSESEALYHALLDLFTGLKLELYSTNKENIEPTFSVKTDSKITCQYDNSVIGDQVWVIGLSGKMKEASDGFGVYASMTNRVTNTVTQTFVEGTDTVEAINAWLSQCPQSSAITYLAQLEGTFEGQIVVPGGITVRLGGTKDRRAKLIGGIRTTALDNSSLTGFVWVQFLDLVSAKDKDTSTLEGGVPNYGIYGTGITIPQRCTFTNYYHAIHCENGELIFGGVQNKFTRNHVAYYLEQNRKNGGNMTMVGYLFEHNDVAIYIKALAPGDSLTRYALENCGFFDNGIDIKNDTGRIFFVAKNHFMHGDVLGFRGEEAGNVSAQPMYDGYKKDIPFQFACTGKLVMTQGGSHEISAGFKDEFILGSGLLEDVNGLSIDIIQSGETGNDAKPDVSIAQWNFGAQGGAGE